MSGAYVELGPLERHRGHPFSHMVTATSPTQREPSAPPESMSKYSRKNMARRAGVGGMRGWGWEWGVGVRCVCMRCRSSGVGKAGRGD
jgi:hypothetical protein